MDLRLEAAVSVGDHFVSVSNASRQRSAATVDQGLSSDANCEA